MALQIQLRRDTSTNWTSSNPILAQGEFGIETNTGKFKIGTGSTAWNSLAYSTPDLTGTSPITYSNGTIGINQALLSLTASQISNLATGVATFLTTPSSANLRTAVTDETGTGSLVFSNNPTFNSAINVLGAAANMTIGRIDGTATTPYIDFNSGSTVVDYDSRIIATGGNGTIGGGTLQVLANSLSLPTGTSIGAVSSTELQFLDGVTSAIQTQLDGKLASNGNATTATTATNLAGGAAGRIPYQSASGTTAFTTTGTAGQVLTSNGSSAPTWSAPAATGFSPFLLSGM